ncbi:MAG: HU family DNA-binding protein [Cypionkella sp.]|nr:HU family DNA-binding protein [Cypionkella sp.]
MAAKSAKSTKTAKPKLAAVASPADVDTAEITVRAPDLTIVDKDGDHSRPAAKGDALKMKDLLTSVITKTGAKKKDAKDVVDAVLAEISAALNAGKSLNLPALGNLRVAKIQDKGDVKMMVLKLRMGGGNSAKDTLADDGEDG